MVEDAGNVIDLRLVETEIAHHLLGEAEVALVGEDMTIMILAEDLDQENFLPVAVEVEGDMVVEKLILAEGDIPDLEVLLRGDTDLRLLPVVHLNLLKLHYSSKMILIGTPLVDLELIVGRIFIMWRICLKTDESVQKLFSFPRGRQSRRLQNKWFSMVSLPLYTSLVNSKTGGKSQCKHFNEIQLTQLQSNGMVLSSFLHN